MKTTVDDANLSPCRPTDGNDSNNAAIAAFGHGANLMLSGTLSMGSLNDTGGTLTAGTTANPVTLNSETVNLRGVDFTSGSINAFNSHIKINGPIGNDVFIGNVGGTVEIVNPKLDKGHVSNASTGATILDHMRQVTSVAINGDLVTALAGSNPIATVRVDASIGSGAETFAHDPGTDKLYITSGNVDLNGLDAHGHHIIPVNAG